MNALHIAMALCGPMVMADWALSSGDANGLLVRSELRMCTGGRQFVLTSQRLLLPEPVMQCAMALKDYRCLSGLLAGQCSHDHSGLD